MPIAIPGFAVEAVIHRSVTSVVYAARRDDGAATVLKTAAGRYPDRRVVAELRREYNLLKRLEVDGVIRAGGLVEHGSGNVAVELERFGRSLEDHLADRSRAPLPLATVLAVGIQVERTLGRLHELNVLHKDIAPRNVLFDADAGAVRLIDFGIASELGRERQGAAAEGRLEGSLPYLSPEQTGRMNRDVDYRSDLYSLGITLFELATGTLPFEATGALEWVHCHIGRPAPAPSSRNAALPRVFDDIIAKLVAKNAEDRYQGSYGLVRDLERCAEALAAHGRIETFPVGRDDVSRRFQAPQRLFGREAELDRLRELFDAVASGGLELCLVAGYSGIGKSALVNELSRTIVREKGHLAQGKFGQFEQSTPYFAVAHACRSLVRQLLRESELRLAALKGQLVTAIGANLRVLVELLPELELVVGAQAPVPELPPTEAQNRFQLTFVEFLRTLAARHPIVLFFDDLQWSDAPTLALLVRLLGARDLAHVLILGAYRSNEVEAGHPLQLALEEIRKARAIHEVHLGPLSREAVRELTAEVVASTPDAVAELADAVSAKASGNPFYANEILKHLHESGAIRFVNEHGRWTWDLDAVRRADAGDNVVDFMVRALRRLPDDAQRVLVIAACIGNTFDLRTLAKIHGGALEETGNALLEPLQRGLITPLTDSYRYASLAAQDDGLDARYRFQHDRVQQAAYALVDEDQRRGTHLAIGRLLLGSGDAAAVDERLMEIVGHLDKGRDGIDDASERLALARLNLRAGVRARQSSAYEAAAGFLDVALELLPANAWDAHYDLAAELGSEVQQCAYLRGRMDDAEAWSRRLLATVRTDVEKAQVLSARTRQYSTSGRMGASIAAAIEGLELLGIQFTAEPDPAAVQRERDAVTTNLRGRRIADLAHAPACTSPRELLGVRLLMEIFPAAFLSGSGQLFPYLVLKAVNLTLEHGNSPESAFTYAAYGMLLCGVLDDPALGLEYGRLAVQMNEQFDDIALKSRVIYVYGMFIHHWSHHWSSMTPWFLRGIESGYQSGDLLYLAYSAQDCIIWDPKLDLETAAREQRKYLAVVKDTGYRDSFDSGTLFLQLQRNLLGDTLHALTLSSTDFDEDACVAGMTAREFMTGVANFHIYRAEIHVFYGDWAGALEHVVQVERLRASSMSLPQLVRGHVVAFLTRASLAFASPAARTPETRAKLAETLAIFERWAAHCPENFAHLAALFRAELRRFDGEPLAALAHYETAITTARANGFVRDEGVANERAAACLVGAGLERAAEGYFRAALHAYDRFGAVRKCRRLEADHPHLRAVAAPVAPDAMTATTRGVDSATLDMASVMKASQTISGELVFDRLWATTLQVLMENAGAQRGSFVTGQGDLVVHATAVAGQPAAPHTGPRAVSEDDPDAPVPVSVLQAVLRTREALVIADATTDERVRSDPYVGRHHPRSMLCVPIGRPGSQFTGAIYLENNLTTGAFTAERVEVLRLLSAQAAISTENARLYEAQERLVSAQRRFVPEQFLHNLGHSDIADVSVGESVAREMSVMFSDLRGFTPITERLGPDKVIALLNRYFACLEVPITECGGFIDSFNGDEVMVLFGVAPERSIDAGIGMCRALERFNRDAAAAGEPTLKMGVGVNTGALVLGTVGAKDRLKCGVVGDTVNLASRVEQLTKHYDAQFLVGQKTYDAMTERERFSFRCIDRVAVKGKVEGIRLYEVLDALPPDLRDLREATRPRLDAALAAYSERRFAEAEGLLREARSTDPRDAVLEILEERCARHARTPPPDGWKGFEALTHK